MKKLFLDIETAGVIGNWDDLLLTGFALDDEDVTVSEGFPEQELHGLLTDPNVAVVSHTPFDPKFFREAGASVNGPLYDTRVMAWVLNENTPLDLDWLVHRYAGYEMDKRLVRHAGVMYFRDDDDQEYALSQYHEWPRSVQEHFADYNRRDVVALRDLFYALESRMDESMWLDYWQTEEVPYTSTLLDMELRGLPVNLTATAQLAEEYRKSLEVVRAELLADAGLPASFNLNSQKQLVAYLFGRVVHLKDTLVLDEWEMGAYKSCADGEHDDCAWGDTTTDEQWHVVDLLPEGFVVDKVGRLNIQGHWVVKGRGLKETPPPVNKLTGEVGKLPSTSSPELLYLHADDEWVRRLCLEYRKLEKLLTTYLDAWPEQARDQHTEWTPTEWVEPQLTDTTQLPPVRGRLYGRFNQTGTVTGRLSSSGPNLQNIPARGARGKAVRGLFEAPDGRVLVVGDYDQLEMRLMAHFSEDRQLLRIFREGHDPHEELAKSIFGDLAGPELDVHAIPAGAAVSYRDAAKTLNYAMGYGAGPKKVAQTLSLLGWPTTKDDGVEYLKEMARFYRGLFRWKEKTITSAKRRGSVKTLGGRRRRLKATFRDTANWKLVGYGERQAVNAIVQGSAADVIRRAMVQWDQSVFAYSAPMLAQVHDEVVFETFDNPLDWGPMLSEIMHTFEQAHGFDLKVPLKFEPHTGKTWAAAKSGVGVELDEDLLDMEDDDGLD